MSVVTGICLITSVVEDDTLIAAVNKWLDERKFGPLIDVAPHGGGSKHPQWNELSAGFNYFPDPAGLAEFVLALDWEEPENVVLIAQPENGRTSVWRPE